MTAATLNARGFVDRVQGHVATACNASVTCTASARGSVIDYALVSPRRSHCGRSLEDPLRFVAQFSGNGGPTSHQVATDGGQTPA
eukprot:2977283-Pyramimonas_sp.AAC.1